MKRNLSKNVEWDPEALKLEMLDWESNPADFDKLALHVKDKLEQELRLKGLDIASLASETELREAIRAAALTFNERYISLPNHVYLATKAFLIRKQKAGQQNRAE